MLLSDICCESRCWSKLTRTLLSGTLLVLQLSFVTSTTLPESTFGTLELDHTRDLYPHKGRYIDEPYLDDRSDDSTDDDYPSNLYRTKRSPLLGRYIKNILDRAQDRRPNRQTPSDDSTDQSEETNQDEDMQEVANDGGQDEEKPAPVQIKSVQNEQKRNGSEIQSTATDAKGRKEGGGGKRNETVTNGIERKVVLDSTSNKKDLDRNLANVKKKVSGNNKKKEDDNKKKDENVKTAKDKINGSNEKVDSKESKNKVDEKKKGTVESSTKLNKTLSHNIPKHLKKDKIVSEPEVLKQESQAVGKEYSSGSSKEEEAKKRQNIDDKKKISQVVEEIDDTDDDEDVDDYEVEDDKAPKTKKNAEEGKEKDQVVEKKKKADKEQKVNSDSNNKKGKKKNNDGKKKKKNTSKRKIELVVKNVNSTNLKDKEEPSKNKTIVLNTNEKKFDINKKNKLDQVKLGDQNQSVPVSGNTTNTIKAIRIDGNTTTKAPQKMNTSEVPVYGSKRYRGIRPTIVRLSRSESTLSPILKVVTVNKRYLSTTIHDNSTTNPNPSPIKNSTLPSSILKLAPKEDKPSSNALKINSSILSNEPIVIEPSSIFYDARDVTYFLESHAAHSIHDPRAYFTEERITRAMTIILKELPRMPENLRFAYLVRTLNELGRKIASKLNYLTIELAAILRKTPDDLGNKPDVSMIINTVKNVFESKEDREPMEESSAHLDETEPIKKLIANDQEKAIIFGQAGKTIADKMAHLLGDYVFQALGDRLTNMTESKRSVAVALFCDALKKGVGDMIAQMDRSDKFKVYKDIKKIFTEVIDQVKLVLKDIIKRLKNITKLPRDRNFDTIIKDGGESFADLNPISHKTALIGAYNTFLFTNLGSSERVMKLFSSLVSRVPPEAKARWINMYEARFDKEFKQTLSGFVTMQGMPSTKGNSEYALLDAKNSSLLITPKLPVAREDYDLQKNKIPARCYLAGRRSRLYLTRALKQFDQSEKIITRIANRLSKWKTLLVHQSGNEIYRMCLPRFEVGLRSWGINGDPQSDGKSTSKFQMKNPLESLNTMRDPFENGVRLGYRIGAKIGYNEERNATLELEYSGGSGNLTARPDSLASRFIGRAAYRKAATAAAKKAFEIAVREGYITALKVSIRAGLKIPAEVGSKMATLKCVSVASMTGLEVGGSFADEFLIDKDVETEQRDFFVKLGKDHGSSAGMAIGEKIGAFVGRQAAEEAYRHAMTHGGKLERAKFHLAEFEAGALLGFEYGIKVGKRVASSVNLDPSAPKMLTIPQPFFSEKKNQEDDVDHWENDLIPPLSRKRLAKLERVREHIPVEGMLSGSYTLTKETKNMWMSTKNSTKTYQLAVKAKGYIIHDVAYLNLNGTVNKLGQVYGSIITQDISENQLKNSTNQA